MTVLVGVEPATPLLLCHFVSNVYCCWCSTSLGCYVPLHGAAFAGVCVQYNSTLPTAVVCRILRVPTAVPTGR